MILAAPCPPAEDGDHDGLGRPLGNAPVRRRDRGVCGRPPVPVEEDRCSLGREGEDEDRQTREDPQELVAGSKRPRFAVIPAVAATERLRVEPAPSSVASYSGRHRPHANRGVAQCRAWIAPLSWFRSPPSRSLRPCSAGARCSSRT